ncbi:trypsin [Anopheles gambiae]|uniref:trypsin n=1 Tax=Anopheles gambiae TaxID=7165 RepID=UPI002AC8B6F6|nr:trypsin [Anopheles gambiae]
MGKKVPALCVFLVAFLVVLTQGEPVLIERELVNTVDRIANEVHENAFAVEEEAVAADKFLAQADSVSPFLVGGGPAMAGAFPAQVAVQIGTAAFCGGTILNQNHILTAAGCVLDANNHLIAANQVTVRAGVLVVDQNAPVMAVNRIFPHPQYNPWTFENDIAVLRLTNNIVFPQVALPNMAPAELNLRIVPDSTVCQVLGWNWQQAAQNVPLQVLNVQYSPRTTCNAQHQGMLHDSMACTVLNQATHGVCAPNRGGGLYCNDLLTGIISFGFGCGTNNTYTVYTQVRYYHHWIQQQFGRTDTPVAGPTPMPGVVGGGGGGGTASSITLSLATVLVAIVAALLLN